MTTLTFHSESHRYEINGVAVPSVTQILRLAGIIEGYNGDSTASIRGRMVHLACEYDDAGELDEASVSKDIVGYLIAWRRFRDATRFMPEAAEKQFYSPTYNFCGTIDRIGTASEQPVLLDIKTGALRPFHAIQLAAYQLGFADATGTNIPTRWGVYLRSDGSFKVEEFRNPRDRQVFLAALTLTRWKEASCREKS